MLGGVLGGGGERACTLILGGGLGGWSAAMAAGRPGCDNNQAVAQLLLSLRWWLAAELNLRWFNNSKC